MGKINSKKKGSKNERDVCKWWKDWTGYDFARVPSSGGLRWSRTTDTVGDLMCSDQKHFMSFPFSIECKAYKDITFNDILKGTKSDVIKFWEQAIGDAKRGKKEPILFFRENGMPKGMYYVATDGNLGHFIVTEYYAKHFNPIKYIKVVNPKHCIYVFDSREIKGITYRSIRKFLKTKTK